MPSQNANHHKILTTSAAPLMSLQQRLDCNKQAFSAVLMMPMQLNVYAIMWTVVSANMRPSVYPKAIASAASPLRAMV